MTSQDNSNTLVDIEQLREGCLNPPNEELGISRLEWLIPVDIMSSAPLRHEPGVAPASLAENTLRQVRNWLAGSAGSASNILWLSGIPTSFTSDDITALCQETSLLAASFSFSTRKGSDQLTEVVPSLALQIASNVPSLRPIIGLTAFHSCDIFSEPLDVQLEALVFNPFRQCVSIGEPKLSAVLVIDGLDLYHDLDTQKGLISSIEMIATTLCIPLRFLITSRQASQESWLPFEPGTHVHIHNGSKPPPPATLQSPFKHESPRNPNGIHHHGFPLLLQSHSSISQAESYSRSLIMLGHGVPLWRPGRSQGAAEYHRQGPDIGDVMYINREGSFHLLFNIFRRPDDPMNWTLNGQYAPLTLDPGEVTRVESFFKPGTVITSTGIVTVKKCGAPLTINFKSRDEEGAMLVLPDGASREDITSTKHLHKYVQRWAPYWYKHRAVPNGSLFIVTGCDKASDFACATFFSHPSHDEPREIDMDYVHNNTGEYPWINQGRAKAHYNKYPNPERTRRFCVFVRGTRIALSTAVWSSYNNNPFARKKSAYTNVLYKSPLGHATESLLVRFNCRPQESEALKRVLEDNNIFHPIFALGPDLFQKYPKASVVILNDTDWSILTQEGHGDWVHMKALIEKLYQHFAVVEDHGVVSLTRKTTDHNDSTRRGVGISQLFRMNRRLVKPIPVGKFVHDLGESSDSDT